MPSDTEWTGWYIRPQQRRSAWDEYLQGLTGKGQGTNGLYGRAGTAPWAPGSPANQAPIPTGWQTPQNTSDSRYPGMTGELGPYQPQSAEELAAWGAANYRVPAAEFRREGLPDLGIPGGVFRSQYQYGQPLNLQLPDLNTQQQQQNGYGYGWRRRGGGGGGGRKYTPRAQTPREYLQSLGLLNWTI